MKNYLLLLAAMTIIGTSCKKEKNDEQLCRISKLITPTGKQIRVTYNDEGKYAKIENGERNETTTAVYTNNSIVITTVTTGTTTLITRRILQLNSSGMISASRLEDYGFFGTLVSSLEGNYTYDGAELTKITSIDSFYSDSYVQTRTIDYTWENDNLVKFSAPTYIGSYEYYLDQPNQQGDIQSIRHLLFGFDINLYMKNKNLTREYEGSTINYELDAAGNIKSVAREETVLYLIEYECN